MRTWLADKAACCTVLTKCILFTKATGTFTVHEHQICCYCTQVERSAARCVIFMVSLLYVVDVGTVALFKWQLLAASSFPITSKVEWWLCCVLCAHPSILGRVGINVPFQLQLPCQCYDDKHGYVSKVTAGSKALEEPHVNKLLPGEEEALSPLNICSGFSLLWRAT